MKKDANRCCFVGLLIDLPRKRLELLQGCPEVMLGYSTEEIEADYFSEKRTFSGVLFEREKTAIDFKKKNGDSVLISASFKELKDGEHLLCEFVDMTTEERLEIYDRSSYSAVFMANTEKGTIELPNETFFMVTGYEKGEVYRLSDLFEEKMYDSTLLLLKRSQESGRGYTMETRIKTADGLTKPAFLYCGGTVFNGEKYVCCSFVDDTVVSLYKRYLDEFRREFAKLSDTFPGGSFEMEMEGDRIVYLSKTAETNRDGRDLQEISLALREEWKQNIYNNYLKNEFTFDCFFTKRNGKSTRISFHVILIRRNGDIRSFLCFYNENDEVRRNVLQLSGLRARLQLLLEQTDDIVFSYDFDDDELSYMSNETINMNSEMHCVVRNFSENYNELVSRYNIPVEVVNSFINKENLGDKEYPISYVRDGEKVNKWLLVKNKRICDENGVVHSVVGTICDITNEKNVILEHEKLKTLDNLTQVLNKQTFESYVEKRCSEDIASDNIGAYILFRITNLSQINESVGILFGDTVLKNLSVKLRNAYGNDTEIGRQSGNSLAVYRSGKERAHIREEALKIANSFLRIFSYVNPESSPRLRIGIAFTDDCELLDAQKLEMMANIALVGADREEECIVFDFGRTGENLSSKIHEVPVDVRPQIRMAMDPLTTEMCKMLFSANDVDAAISSILALIGLEYDISRAYILEVTPRLDVMMNTYEWCADGVTPCKGESQHVNVENAEEYQKLFVNNMYITDDYTALNRSFPSIGYLYGSYGPKRSTFLYSMKDGGKIHSIIGFDVYGKDADWNEKRTQQLSMLCAFLGTQLIKLRAQEEKHLEHQLFQAVIKHLNLFVYTVNPTNYELLFEGHINELISKYVGQKCYKVLKNRTTPCINCPILGLTSSDSYSMRSYDENSKSWTDITAFRSKDFYGKESAVISCHDISSYNRFLSKTDELTDSPMFNSLPKRIEQLINENPDKSYVMMFINVKKLRMINEAYGFAVGNKMLISISKIISDSLHPYETYSRISGDKFVVLFSRNGNDDPSMSTVDMLRKKVCEKLHNEVPIANINFNIGVYYINENSTVTEMLDKSCIAAKAAASIGGGSNLLVYNDEISKREEFITFIESRMEYALTHDEFKLYLQPKFDLKTKQVAGAEALTRWIMKDGSMVMPGDFIPLFEENGFIKKMDFYIYEQVFRHIRKWLDNGLKPMLISMNVSRIHIGSNDFAEQLINLLRQYDIDPGMIELELTETMFVNSMEEMVDFIESLHRAGFVISIDDFGSGYSSLNLLKDVPIDVLKIDKSLFSDKSNPKEKPLLSGVVSIAKNMEMGTICEGVENEEQANFLSSINCDLAQGFYFQKPIYAEHFEELYFNLS